MAVPHSSPSDRHLANIASRVARELAAREACIDQRQVAADIRMLAHSQAGQRCLENALMAYGDDDLALIARARCHRIAADLTCDADLPFHRARIWSLLGVAMGCAGAAMVLAAIGQDTPKRLIGLIGAVVVIAGIGLRINMLAAWRRRKLLSEAAAVKALAATCSAVTPSG